MFGYAIVHKTEFKSQVKYLTYSFEVAVNVLAELDENETYLIVKLDENYQPEVGENYQQIYPFIVGISSDPSLKIRGQSLI